MYILHEIFLEHQMSVGKPLKLAGRLTSCNSKVEPAFPWRTLEFGFAGCNAGRQAATLSLWNTNLEQDVTSLPLAALWWGYKTLHRDPWCKGLPTNYCPLSLQVRCFFFKAPKWYMRISAFKRFIQPPGHNWPLGPENRPSLRCCSSITGPPALAGEPARRGSQTGPRGLRVCRPATLTELSQWRVAFNQHLSVFKASPLLWRC